MGGGILKRGDYFLILPKNGWRKQNKWYQKKLMR